MNAKMYAKLKTENLRFGTSPTRWIGSSKLRNPSTQSFRKLQFIRQTTFPPRKHQFLIFAQEQSGNDLVPSRVRQIAVFAIQSSCI